ncbi:transglutaminase-like domain-containing protein [Marinobacter sp. F3R11]|uniref:transglutaminase-like domain-containing protein n=1 Tax=Marinobacter sp. F3R11 TaxID=2267231 RepID=UPI000DE851C1|nr:transglutaminase-like domain-containing protein [Marinobacter sp. F3R11]RBW51403.1 hypothetical protein DS878_02390 [Marinobacter sp. F3R11]
MFSDFRTEAMFSVRFKRLVSALVLFFFSFTFYSPAVLATLNEVERQSNPSQNSLAFINPIGETIEKLGQKVSSLSQVVAKERMDQIPAQLGNIEDLAKVFHERDERVREELYAERQSLIERGLPDEILARHEQFEQNYRNHADSIELGLEKLARWDDSERDTEELLNTLRTLQSHLQYPVRNPQQSFSGDLDFVSPAPRSLYTSQSAIEGLLGVNGEPAWDLSDYLETDSATATSDRIRDIVTELGPDPLALYTWVHDTIRFVPSYGVMQGADYTIQSEQGNAFDTASTLIALYREAGIPARFSYGTVAISAEAARNWVGGVSNIDAATNILSQGGIPQQQFSYGGASEEVEMEHVWVEAWIDGEWVGLDPSFKEHTFTEGMDVRNELPLDAEAFLNNVKASATVNEAEGWVQGMDPLVVQNELDAYQASVESFIGATGDDTTLGDVLGTQQIVPEGASVIEDVVLPFNRVRASAVIPNLPESLYYRFRLQIGNATGGILGIPVQWAGTAAELDRLTPELVGKSLAISFRPATELDQQTLESYLPENPETVEDLPSQLPANTINMIGEITVDGDVVATTSSVSLGQSLMVRLGFEAPERSWDYSENNLVAGQYQAVGIDMQGISPTQLMSLQAQLESVKNKLEAENYSGLTKHDLVGGILQSGIQGYLAEIYAMDKIAAMASGVVYNRSPSYGTFSTQMNVSYFFGSPRNVLFSGVVMDVDRISSNTESVDNCYEDWVAFNRSSGMRSSAYEHLIPERLFSTEDEPAEGVSTAKALSLAMAQGQRIYTLTSENASSLSQITIDSEARSEIQSALQRGYEVTAHAQPINVNGWEGSGYSIIDPERGVGAYKISGGVSGGFLDDDTANLLTLLGIGGGLVGILASVGLLVLLSGVISLVLALNGFLEFSSSIDGTNCSNSGAAELYVGLVFGAAVLGLLFGGLAAFALLTWVGFFAAGAISGSFIEGKICK